MWLQRGWMLQQGGMPRGRQVVVAFTTSSIVNTMLVIKSSSTNTWSPLLPSGYVTWHSVGVSPRPGEGQPASQQGTSGDDEQ